MRRRFMVKVLAAAVAVVMMGSAAGCGNRTENGADVGGNGNVGGGENVEGRVYNVSILQLMSHNALDDARLGFIDGLASEGFVEGQNVTFSTFNPERDLSVGASMAQQIVDSSPDLVLGIATPVSQILRTATMEMADPVPVVFTAITDPVGAGLVDSMERPNTNLTGMTDLYPLEYLFAFMKRLLPDVETIGIIYNSGEQNSFEQAEMAAAKLSELGFEYVRMSVTGTADVQQVAEALVQRVDVVYSPTCNTIAAAMPIVADVAAMAGIAVLAADVGSVQSGALATEGIDYYQLGWQTAIMAAQILRGEAQPQTMPVQSQDPERTGVFINMASAERLGIEISPEILANATLVGE